MVIVIIRFLGLSPHEKQRVASFTSSSLSEQLIRLLKCSCWIKKGCSLFHYKADAWMDEDTEFKHLLEIGHWEKDWRLIKYLRFYSELERSDSIALDLSFF